VVGELSRTNYRRQERNEIHIPKETWGSDCYGPRLPRTYAHKIGGRHWKEFRRQEHYAGRGYRRNGRLRTTRETVAFAYRSRKQAREKATEFSKHGFPTVAIVPLWEHLNEICLEFGEDRIEREEFEAELESCELCEILSEISNWNPQVYAELERRRKAVWGQYPFEGTTFIAMTHKGAQLWPTNANMRAWHHPGFDPDGDQVQVDILSKDFNLLVTVFDDPEFDDFVHIIHNHLYHKLQSIQEAHPNWHNIHR
jgi:hypothetical protein